MTAANALTLATVEEEVLRHGALCGSLFFAGRWDREDLGGKWTTSRTQTFRGGPWGR